VCQVLVKEGKGVDIFVVADRIWGFDGDSMDEGGILDWSVKLFNAALLFRMIVIGAHQEFIIYPSLRRMDVSRLDMESAKEELDDQSMFGLLSISG